MPASFIQDETIWTKAKAAAGSTTDYAKVTAIYKRMGGRIRAAGTKEAAGSQSMAQLVRPQARWARRHGHFESIKPSSVDPAKRQVEVILLSEGPGNSRDKNFYTEEFIREGVSRFNGTRCFINHPTMDERESRPEGDVKNQCGWFSDTALVKMFDQKQGREVWAVQANFNPTETAAGREAYATALAALRYNEEFPNSPNPYAGFSINVGGESDGTMEYEGEIWHRVSHILEVRSVDMVTRPARGGRFIKLLESVAAQDAALSIPDGGSMIKKLKAKIKALEAAFKAEKDKRKRTTLQESLATNRQLLLEAEADFEESVDGLEADDVEASDPTPDGDDTDPVDANEDDENLKGALKKLMPQGHEESEDDHNNRVREAINTVRGGGKAKESKAKEAKAKEAKAKEAQAAEDLAALRESQAGSGARARNVRESEELLTLRAQNLMFKRRAMASRMLAESDLPEGVLTVSDLVRHDETGMKREIAKVQRILEATGTDFGGAFNPEKRVGGRGEGDFVSALESHGIPTVELEEA